MTLSELARGSNFSKSSLYARTVSPRNTNSTRYTCGVGGIILGIGVRHAPSQGAAPQRSSLTNFWTSHTYTHIMTRSKQSFAW